MKKRNVFIKLPSTTPVVLWFIGICIAFSFFQAVTSMPQGVDILTMRLGLIPRYVWHDFQIWRLITYVFLHAGLIHLFINLFVFWMMGSELEKYWGSREFLKYILIGGLGAGILHMIFQFQSEIPVIGASGIVFAVLLAFGMTFPDRIIYIYFLFPIKARYLVILLCAVELLMLFSAGINSAIAHLAHLGGMLFGFLYLKFIKRNLSNKSSLKRHFNIRDVAPKKPRAYFYDDETLKREVDRILLKIRIRGKESLSSEELQILQEASIRFGNIKR